MNPITAKPIVIVASEVTEKPDEKGQCFEIKVACQNQGVQARWQNAEK